MGSSGCSGHMPEKLWEAVCSGWQPAELFAAESKAKQHLRVLGGEVRSMNVHQAGHT